MLGNTREIEQDKRKRKNTKEKHVEPKQTQKTKKTKEGERKEREEDGEENEDQAPGGKHEKATQSYSPVSNRIPKWRASRSMGDHGDGIINERKQTQTRNNETDETCTNQHNYAKERSPTL